MYYSIRLRSTKSGEIFLGLGRVRKLRELVFPHRDGPMVRPQPLQFRQLLKVSDERADTFLPAVRLFNRSTHRRFRSSGSHFNDRMLQFFRVSFLKYYGKMRR